MRLTGFPPTVRALVQERAEMRCERCGIYCERGQLHHRRPRQHGGSRRPDTNRASNALWLCSTLDHGLDCHGYIESERTNSYAHGWLLRQNQSPPAVKVFRRSVWVLLDDDGGVQEVAA